MKILTLSITRNRGMIGDTETKVPPSNKILRRALPGPQRTISQVYKYRYQVIRPNLENIGGKGVGGHLRGGHPRIHHREGVRGGLNIQKLYILYL